MDAKAGASGFGDEVIPGAVPWHEAHEVCAITRPSDATAETGWLTTVGLWHAVSASRSGVEPAIFSIFLFALFYIANEQSGAPGSLPA